MCGRSRGGVRACVRVCACMYTCVRLKRRRARRIVVHFSERAVPEAFLVGMNVSEDASDELEALESILGEDFRYANDGGTTICKLHVVPTERDAGKSPVSMWLAILLSAEYPTVPCVVSIESVKGASRSEVMQLESQLQVKANECASDGMVSIFDIQQLALEWVTENAAAMEAAAAVVNAEVALQEAAEIRQVQDEVDRMTALSVQEKAEEARALDSYKQKMGRWVHGNTLTDRKSVFQAHIAGVHDAQEAQNLMAVLCTDNKIARATHNIWAYRIIQPAKNSGDKARSDPVIICDNDDDGESAAGGRLMHLMDLMKVKNVVCVVSRWYGGVHLGPARFKHINNVARELLEKNGYDTRKPMTQ